MRPLHAIADHSDDLSTVGRWAFMILGWPLVGFLIWGWVALNNIACICFTIWFGLPFACAWFYRLWQWEEDQPATFTSESLQQRIDELEEELGIAS